MSKNREPTPAETVAELFNRNPSSLAPEDRLAIIRASRADRTRWEAKEAKRQAKKDGDEENEDE